MSEVASPPSGAATPEHSDEPATVRVVAQERPAVAATGPGSLLGGRYRLTTRVGADTAAGA